MASLPPADRLSTPAQATRAHWLTLERAIGYARVFIAVYLVAAIVWAALSHDMVDAKGKPLGYDFITFWAGSFLALAGDAAASFDAARIVAVEKLAVPASNQVFLWHYPPTFHLVVLPLALLPYIAAYATWIVATFAAYVAVVRRFVPRVETLWLLLAFPGTLINALQGQNGFLTAALFGAALLQLEMRPLLAGVLFGLLSCKPQLGVLIPVALLCARQWSALAAATAATLAFAGLSLALFGMEAWLAFWNNLPLVRSLLDSGALPWSKIPSFYVALRLLGVSVLPAYALHGLLALCVVATVAMVWRRASPLPLRAAVLVAGTVLVPPYLFDYDLALLAIPIAILGWHGVQHGWHAYEREVLVASWLMPLLAAGFAEQLGVPIAFPVLLALFACAVRRACTDRPACI